MASRRIVIKVKHSATGDLRRLALDDWPSLEALDRHLRVIFSGALPVPYSLFYFDQDGDKISITSNLELREALSNVSSASPNPVLNLTLSPGETSSSITFSTLIPTLRSSGFFYGNLRGSALGFERPNLTSSSSSSSTDQTPPISIAAFAPSSFVASLTELVSGKSRAVAERLCDLLIDFGGDLEKTREIIAEQEGLNFVASPADLIVVSAMNFSPSFAKSVLALEAAGFDRRDVIPALIRNGGVPSNAALELAALAAPDSPNKLRCPAGHDMLVSSHNLGNYQQGWFCDACRKRGNGQRWHCGLDGCEYDLCFDCHAAPVSPPLPQPTPVPSQPPLPSSSSIDGSLPESLLLPIRQLEALGFTDRMRIIELIVIHAGNISNVAIQLAEERRQAEELVLQQQREEAARREAEERIRAAAEEARRQAEAEAERRRQAEFLAEQEEKRSKAADIARQNPEKIGADIAYLGALGFDPISSMTSLFNCAGDLEAAIEELLRLQQPQL